MNKKILELEKQSYFLFKDENSIECLVFSKEKFAQLILQQCISMADDLQKQYFSNRKSTIDFNEKNIFAEGEAACDALKFKIKNHFGVNI